MHTRETSWRFFAALALITATIVVAAGQAPAPVPPRGGAFPVAIRVDAGSARGPLRPIWRFFGADEPNYAYMKDGRKLLANSGSSRPSASTSARTTCSRPATARRPSSGARPTPTARTRTGSRSTTGRFSTASSTRTSHRGVRPYAQIGFMPRDLSTRPEPYQHSWTPTAKYDAIFTGWAYPPKDYGRWADLARAWVAHASRGTAAPKSSSGTGRSGTSRTSATGRARRRSSTSCTTTRSTACAARCRRRGSAAPTRRVTAGRSCAPFSITPCAARTTRPAVSARRSTSSPSTRRDSPRSWTATCGWASRISSPRSTRVCKSSRRTRS